MSFPDEAWPAVPLNRMNCVDQPPESAICGKNLSSEVEGSLSLVVLQLSKISKRATGWIDQAPSHAATANRWLMN